MAPGKDGRHGQPPNGTVAGPTVPVGLGSPTLRYLRDRQRVRGRRWWLSQDPEIAAGQLLAYTGGVRRAKAWADELIANLERCSRGRT